MTAQMLRTRSLKDLADMARKRGVHGWHSMRKDQLVRALVQTAKPGSNGIKSAKKMVPENRSVKRTVARVRSSIGRNGSAHSLSNAAQNPRIAKRLEQAKMRLMRAKILATDGLDGRGGAPAKDRLVVM